MGSILITVCINDRGRNRKHLNWLRVGPVRLKIFESMFAQMRRNDLFRYGRRHALLVVCIAMATSGSLLSITKSYIAYSLTRAVLGLFAYSPFLILFVHGKYYSHICHSQQNSLHPCSTPSRGLTNKRAKNVKS